MDTRGMKIGADDPELAARLLAEREKKPVSVRVGGLIGTALVLFPFVLAGVAGLHLAVQAIEFVWRHT